MPQTTPIEKGRGFQRLHQLRQHNLHNDPVRWGKQARSKDETLQSSKKNIRKNDNMVRCRGKAEATRPES